MERVRSTTLRRRLIATETPHSSPIISHPTARAVADPSPLLLPRSSSSTSNKQNDKPPFSIDLVYTWIDGKDGRHQGLRTKYLPVRETRRAADHTGTRWTPHDELLYSLRTVTKFAPWVRRIYIVVSHHQLPGFLDEHKCVVYHGGVLDNDHSHRLIIVNDSYLLPAKHLPTFNSQAIEAHLHRLPGLSEHFIYMCDDMMFGGDVQWQDFFDANGRMNIFIKNWLSYHPQHVITARTPGHAAARINSNRLLKQHVGPTTTKLLDLDHQAKAGRKTVWEAVWSLPWAKVALNRTSASRFREADNVEVFTLMSFLAIEAGEAQLQRTSSFCCNYSFGVGTVLEQLKRSPKKFLCFNVFNAEIVAFLRGLVGNHTRSPFERGQPTSTRMPADDGNSGNNGNNIRWVPVPKPVSREPASRVRSLTVVRKTRG